MYYQVDFNHIDRTYCVYPYTGGTAIYKTDSTQRVGWNIGNGNTIENFNPIKFYEK
jgi:hypothetical protein